MNAEPILERTGAWSWVGSAFFIASGSFVALLLGGVIGTGPVPTGWAFAAAALISGAHIAAGVWLFVSSPSVTLFVAPDCLIIERSWPFLRRAHALDMARIAELVVEETPDSDGDIHYRLAVRTTSGQHVRVPAITESNRQPLDDALRLIAGRTGRSLPVSTIRLPV